jgi:hypothetical protein
MDLLDALAANPPRDGDTNNSQDDLINFMERVIKFLEMKGCNFTAVGVAPTTAKMNAIAALLVGLLAGIAVRIALIFMSEDQLDLLNVVLAKGGKFFT